MTQTMIAPHTKKAQTTTKPPTTQSGVIEFAALTRSQQLKMLKNMGYDQAAALEFRAVALGESHGDRIELGQRVSQARVKKS